jgi:hypothetical protein
MLGVHEFYVEVRSLFNLEHVYCIPAAIISCNGHDTPGEEIILRFDYISGTPWDYTVQATDPVDTPFLVTPWSTGSSSSNGIEVYDGYVTVEGSATENSNLTLIAWALFEGSAFPS